MKAVASVRRHALTLLLVMVALISMVAGAGAVGIVSLTEDVSALVDDLRPAAYSNIALRNDLSGAQSAARGWVVTGDPEFRQRFTRSAREAEAELRRLERAVADNPRLASGVARQRAAIEDWLNFGRRLVEPPRRTPAVAALVRGQVLFDRVVGTNDVVSFTVNAVIDERGEHARTRGSLVLVVVALISLLGLALTAVVSTTLVRRVSGPLHAMENTVEQLAEGDLTVRAPVAGPREVRRVARALNALAEENQRARQMEEQVRERLSRLDRAKDDFVSTVSHELRTPLTSISGYVELFEDDLGEELSAHERGMLTVIKRNVSRLRSLIEDLLTLSSVEDEAYHPAHEPWGLNQLAADAVHDVTPAGVRAQVSVGLQPAEQELWVLGDGDQLSRAVLNLLVNAVKFNRPGGAVQVTLSSEGGEGRIAVRDTGIGVPADELAALGTRFFRASNAVDAEVGGTGLGLRIVQSIAARHGGRLTLESQVGEGTTATLVLPLAGSDVAGNKPIGQKITQG